MESQGGRPFIGDELQLRELYYAKGRGVIESPCTERQMEKWDFFAELDKISIYSIREVGINKFFQLLVDEHPEWNVFVVRHPRYFPAMLHSLNYVKVISVESGTCVLNMDGRDYSLSAGDICFLSPGILHSLGAFEDNAIALNLILRRSIAENCFVSFLSRDDVLSKFFSQIFYNPGADPVVIFHTEGNSQIQKILTLLEREAYDIRDCFTIQMTEGYLLELFGVLLRHHSNQVTVVDRMNKISDENLVAFLRFLNENYTDISLTQLAKKFHYSTSYASKLIKKYAGCSFLDFVRKKKLEKAANLLASGSVSLRDVPEAAGFSDRSYFYRCFRDNYGVTPLEYQTMHAGKADTR